MTHVMMLRGVSLASMTIVTASATAASCLLQWDFGPASSGPSTKKYRALSTSLLQYNSRQPDRDVYDEGGRTDGVPILPKPFKLVPSSQQAHDGPGKSAALNALASRMELHLQDSLKSIHEGAHGPLSSFVDQLEVELCAATGLPRRRLKFLSIRGEKFSLDADHAADVGRPSKSASGSTNMALISRGQSRGLPDGADISETIFDFEVLPGNEEVDPSPETYSDPLERALHESRSNLMTGPLAEMLQNATLVVPHQSKSAAIGIRPFRFLGMFFLVSFLLRQAET